MSVPSSGTGDEGRTCGLGHHDSDRTDTTSSARRSDQRVPMSR